MASDAGAAPGLSLSRETFARLTPIPFLAAHLKQPKALRPNGRRLDECRTPTIHTGSLAHSNGSAVVRLGDTAVVCGIRGEILLASDVPHYPRGEDSQSTMVEDLGLLVPNVELSTGCSPAHVPGNPPTSLAQSLSYRISTLLYDSSLIEFADLQIQHQEPKFDDDSSEQPPALVTKGLWTLYIDILCLALDGNAFDAAWIALVAALRDTSLPGAKWDQDLEAMVCSPLSSEGRRLNLHSDQLPISSTFVFFTTASPMKRRETAEGWLLADPDTNEEDACNEAITITSFPADEGYQNSRIEKSGGSFITPDLIAQCCRQAEQHRVEVIQLLSAG